MQPGGCVCGCVGLCVCWERGGVEGGSRIAGAARAGAPARGRLIAKAGAPYRAAPPIAARWRAITLRV